jgi:hypothetical protein
MPAARHPAPSRHLYAAIADTVRHAIETRQIEPGHNIPSEREMAERHAVARQTVRAAVDRLQAAGFVARDRLGTYVLGTDGPRGLGPHGVAVGEHEFPGLLLRTPVLHCTGLLADAGTAPGEGTAGHVPLVYRHWVYCHDGRVGQSSVSSFHRRLVDLVPPLAEAVGQVRSDVQAVSSGPLRVDPQLGTVLGWLRTVFPDAQQTDRVQALPRTVRHTAQDLPQPAAHVRVERTINNPDGPPLLRTVFRVFDDQALLTSQPATAPLGGGAQSPGRPPTQRTGVYVSARDRAWLEAWLLPGAPERHLAARARIILACESATVEEAAARLNISGGLVTAWLGRYTAGGINALRQPVRTQHATRRRGD